ncbi:UPF0047-domain-containing protein [Xylariaceae sp. FL0804]|nr:UPF0047-domain-containing protein [Xylariaceae sp. FL0804]
MPSSSSLSNNFFTLLFVSVLLVCLFPGAFHYLTCLPFALLSSATTSSSGGRSSSRQHSDPAPLPPPLTNTPDTMWFQRQFTLPPRSRGSYLVTDHVAQSVPEIAQVRVGLLNLFVQHTSCALSLNENWDDDVRADMSDALDRIAPEAGPKGEDLYRHSAEGSDDMPAHIKSALIGASVTIPIKDGKLATGTWQGIWYLEFRQMKHTRKVVATIQGEKA